MRDRDRDTDTDNVGRPCPEYIPTDNELLVIARHWLTDFVWHDLTHFVRAALGGRLKHAKRWRVATPESEHARGRCDQIANFLGDSVLTNLRREIDNDLIERAIAYGNDYYRHTSEVPRRSWRQFRAYLKRQLGCERSHWADPV